MIEQLESFRRRHKRDREVQEGCSRVTAELERGSIDDAYAKWLELAMSRHNWGAKSMTIARSISEEFIRLGAKQIDDSKCIELQERMLDRMHRMDKKSRSKGVFLTRLLLTAVLLALIAGTIYIVVDILTTTDMIVVPFILVCGIALWSYGIWYVWKSKPSELDKIIERI